MLGLYSSKCPLLLVVADTTRDLQLYFIFISRARFSWKSVFAAVKVHFAPTNPYVYFCICKNEREEGSFVATKSHFQRQNYPLLIGAAARLLQIPWLQKRRTCGTKHQVDLFFSSRQQEAVIYLCRCCNFLFLRRLRNCLLFVWTVSSVGPQFPPPPQ